MTPSTPTLNRTPRALRKAHELLEEAERLPRPLRWALGDSHRRAQLGKLWRYAMVSVAASITTMTVLGSLVGLIAFPAGWSNVLATAAGTALSFELNRRWVWGGRSGKTTPGQVLSFWLLSFLGLAVSTWAVHTAATLATNHHFDRMLLTMVVEGANIAAWGALWVANFLILDRLLFRHRPHKAAPPVGPVGETA